MSSYTWRDQPQTPANTGVMEKGSSDFVSLAKKSTVDSMERGSNDCGNSKEKM